MKNMLRVTTISPYIYIGNVSKNVGNIAEEVEEIIKNTGADIIVTPELSLTGYTAQDVFMSSSIREKLSTENLYDTLKPIINISGNYGGTLIALGAPIEVNNRLYNCAILIKDCKIVAIIPKCYLPNYNEFYEHRWFTSALEVEKPSYISIKDKYGYVDVPFEEKIVLKFQDVSIGVEICEDLWAPIPTSSEMAINGAEVILNLSASNETIGKAQYRRNLVAQQSARCLCGYVYCSAGSSESTSDVVFSGHNIIAENGTILAESEIFDKNEGVLTVDIDLDRIRHDRLVNKTFADSHATNRVIPVNMIVSFTEKERILRNISITPFVPHSNISERCKEIFAIQVEGLARRWQRTGSKSLVVGVSGGLDSTLALLVAVGAADILGYSHERVCGVTMPCFGTTSRTKNNAVELMKSLKCSIKEVNIGESVKQHLKDIELNEDDRSIAYENAQARERTQVLMDIANMIGGFVVGTGDLSELALGWCTYNGDHMSMYSVNNSIPKTLVRTLVKVIGCEMCSQNRKVVFDILDTPVSPELLPPSSDGSITQLTEDSVGPYVLNDFFLYYTIRFGMSATKIYELAKVAVEQSKEYKFSNEEIKKWLKKFYIRFAKAQFKRNCCPDGVKVGSVSFSPRGDWRMPTEFDVHAILDEINNLN